MYNKRQSLSVDSNREYPELSNDVVILCEETVTEQFSFSVKYFTLQRTSMDLETFQFKYL